MIMIMMMMMIMMMIIIIVILIHVNNTDIRGYSLLLAYSESDDDIYIYKADANIMNVL